MSEQLSISTSSTCVSVPGVALSSARRAWRSSAWSMSAPIAVLEMMIPYQLPAEVPLRARKITGEAAVPCTFSVPFTVISVRLVSRPDACMSPLSNSTCTPAWMVSVVVPGTVTSPCTM